MAASRTLRDRALTVLMLLALIATLLPAAGIIALPQAQAGTGGDCAIERSNSTTTQRVQLFFAGGQSLDSNTDECTEVGGNDIVFDAYPDILVHISCSEDLTALTFPDPLGQVTSFALQSVNRGGNTAGSCQDSFVPTGALESLCEADAGTITGEVDNSISTDTDATLTVSQGGTVVEETSVDVPFDSIVTLRIEGLADGTYQVLLTSGGAEIASEEITVDCAPDVDTPDVEVVKTNDADDDATFSDDETASGPGQDVTFQAVVTNTGDIAGTIMLSDAFGTSDITVFGAGATVSTSCDGGAFGNGDELQPGESTTCVFTLGGYSPAAGTFIVNTVTVDLRDGSTLLATDDDDSTVRTPDTQSHPGVAVIKTNDADDDDAFGDDETASGPGADVEFHATVTNTGDVAGTIELSDAFGSEDLDVFSDDATVTTVCLDDSDAVFAADDLLAPGATVDCTFTLSGYSPAAGTSITNVVTVDLVIDARVAATDSDPSTVRTPDAPVCVEYTLAEQRAFLGGTNRGISTADAETGTLNGIPSDACPFPINYTSYQLPGGQLRPFAEQILFDNESAIAAGADYQTDSTIGNGDTLVVTLPPCAWQVDLYLGDDVFGDEEGEQGAPHGPSNPDYPYGSTLILVAWDSFQSPEAPPCTEAPVLTLAPCLIADSELSSSNGLDSTGTATNPNAYEIEVSFAGTNVESVNGVDTDGDTVTTVTLQPGDNILVFSNSTVGDTIELLLDGDVVDSEQIVDGCLPPTLVLDLCLVTDIEPESETTLDSQGTATNPNDFPIEVRFGNTNVESVNGVDTGGDTVTTVTLEPGENVIVLSNSSVGEAITVSYRGQKVAVERITDDCERGVEVVKANDADGDGGYTDDETAPSAEADVAFEVTVTNTGELPGTVTLVDEFDSTTVILFGEDAEIPTQCTTDPDGDVDGEPFGIADLLGPGASITCRFLLEAYSPPAGEQLDNVVTATLTTRIGDEVDEDDSTVRSPEPEADVDVVKTNDANNDTTFSDVEFAPAPSSDVTFRAVVTNTGDVAGQVRLYDRLDDGSEPFLFGLAPEASTGVDTTCVDGTLAPFGETDLLAPGASITCTFELVGYSPPDETTERVNRVRVELVAYTFDQGDGVTDVDVLAEAEDPSTVLSTVVGGEVLTPPEPEEPETPGTEVVDEEPQVLGVVLARTGADTGVIAAIALAMIALGVLTLRRVRQERGAQAV